MEEPKKCRCKYCGCYFVPSPKHPHQQCCLSEECQKAQDREREHRCRKKRNKDPARRMAESQRKHAEYIKRKERKQKYPVSPEQTSHPPVRAKEMPDVMLGMLQMITQEKDAERLTYLIHKCGAIGKALRL